MRRTEKRNALIAPSSWECASCSKPISGLAQQAAAGYKVAGCPQGINESSCLHSAITAFDGLLAIESRVSAVAERARKNASAKKSSFPKAPKLAHLEARHA